MADNENTTAPEPQENEPTETPEPVTTGADTPPPDNLVSDDVARQMDALSEHVREEREAADRARMTTIVVFVILIAFIVGYMAWLRSTLDDQLSAESVVNLIIVEGEAMLAAGVEDVPEGAGWNDTVAYALDRRLESFSDEMLRELPRQEEEIAEALRTGIENGAEQGVQVLTDQVLPELRRTSMERIEGEVAAMMDKSEKQIKEAVDQVIEQNREDLQQLSDQQAVEQALSQAFEERMGGPLDEGFKRISGHIEQAAATMHDLATAMENDNLTEEQELEVLMIQVSHYWFTQIEDEDIQEALQR